jgi:hypothetical protein
LGVCHLTVVGEQRQEQMKVSSKKMVVEASKERLIKINHPAETRDAHGPGVDGGL